MKHNWKRLRRQVAQRITKSELKSSLQTTPRIISDTIPHTITKNDSKNYRRGLKLTYKQSQTMYFRYLLTIKNKKSHWINFELPSRQEHDIIFNFEGSSIEKPKQFKTKKVTKLRFDWIFEELLISPRWFYTSKHLGLGKNCTLLKERVVNSRWRLVISVLHRSRSPWFETITLLVIAANILWIPIGDS